MADGDIALGATLTYLTVGGVALALVYYIGIKDEKKMQARFAREGMDYDKYRDQANEKARKKHGW